MGLRCGIPIGRLVYCDHPAVAELARPGKPLPRVSLCTLHSRMFARAERPGAGEE